MEVTADAFCRGLDERHASRVNRIERTGSDFLGLLWVLGTDLPVLGDVQALDGSRAKRCGHLYRAAMTEKHVPTGCATAARH